MSQRLLINVDTADLFKVTSWQIKTRQSKTEETYKSWADINWSVLVKFLSCKHCFIYISTKVFCH